MRMFIFDLYDIMKNTKTCDFLMSVCVICVSHVYQKGDLEQIFFFHEIKFLKKFFKIFYFMEKVNRLQITFLIGNKYEIFLLFLLIQLAEKTK